MTFVEFAKIVKAMRAAQKWFFGTRDNKAKYQAMDLEKKVDAAVKDILNPPVPSLFDDAEHGAKP